MADFNQPTLTTNYNVVLDTLKARDVDAISLAESPTNPPTGAIRFNRTDDKFQEWSGASWVDQLISLAGGGTGASSAAAARTNLGLGSIATQNSNAVTITGGSINGLASLGVSGDAVINGRLDISSPAVNALEVTGGIRAGSGNVDIIGTDGRIPELSSTYFASQTIVGSWTFSSQLTITAPDGFGLRVSNNAPGIYLNETDAAVNNRLWRILGNLSKFSVQVIDDAVTTAVDVFTITRSGVSVIGVGLGVDFLCNLRVANHPVGAGQTAFPITAGRNTSGTGAPGIIEFVDKTGISWFLWVDTTGDLRIGNSPPAESFTDIAGTVVGTQT